MRLVILVLVVAFATGACSRGGRSQSGDGEARAAQEAATFGRPVVRVIVHPNDPAVLYITDLPTGGPVSIYFARKRGITGRLLALNLNTGQWTELNLRDEVRARLGVEDAEVTFEVGGHSGSTSSP
jgi:hypothetical protein